MRALNLPDLHRTDLNAQQRGARQQAIDTIMRGFVDSPREAVADRLDEPMESTIQGPSDFTREDLRRGLSGPSRSVGSAGSAPDDGGAADQIAAGRGQLEGDLATKQASRGQAVIGASDVQAEHGRRTGKAWFSDRK